MVSPIADVNSIERCLRQVLVVYANARTRGDFLEATLAVHNALEDALNFHLGEQASELTFSQKARAVLLVVLDGPGRPTVSPGGRWKGKRDAAGAWLSSWSQ
jgi:hypothetical protein